MKKLVAMMIGLGLMMGTVSMFAQDKPADEKKTEKKAKKGGKKKNTKKDEAAKPAA